MQTHLKTRREAKQQRQRKFEMVDVQETILALLARIDEPDRPATLQYEVASVKASIERGSRVICVSPDDRK